MRSIKSAEEHKIIREGARICNVGGLPTLRTYLKGGSSARNGGVLTRGSWTHIAVVYDKVAGKRLGPAGGGLFGPRP